MNMKHIWTTGASALAIAASITMAQSQPPKNAQNDHGAQNVNLMRASTVIGMKVENSGGEKIGSINNLAIDLTGGLCRFAVLSRGGALGIGDKLYAIPFKAFKFTGGKEVCILDVPKDRLDAAPEFTNDRWNTISDEQWGTTIYTYYNIKPDFSVEKTTVKTTTSKPAMLIKGSDAVGMDVHNQKDEDLGEIEDLMVDTNSGRVAYAVLAFGGWLGMGEKLFAVPWQALNLNADKKQFVLNVEKDKLKSAPGFDKKHWPDMNDLAWSKDVHAFYGSDPNWIYGYSGANMAGDKTTGGWGMNDEYNRKFDAKNVQTVTCTVNDVSNSSPMKGMSDGTVLTCITDKNEAVYVHTGPKWYMEKQDRQFSKGELIKVTGCRVDLGDGKPAIMATEIEVGGQVMKLRDKSGHPMWAAWYSSK